MDERDDVQHAWKIDDGCAQVAPEPVGIGIADGVLPDGWERAFSQASVPEGQNSRSIVETCVYSYCILGRRTTDAIIGTGPAEGCNGCTQTIR